MENQNKEEVKMLSKFFFNKIINEFNNDLVNLSFVEFLEKKAASVPNEKKKKLFIVELS